MRLGVLGPLLVEVGGRTVDPGSPKQRSVLARLAAEGGRVVSTDRFVEDLWNGEPPPKALGALQVYISNLRRVLEPDRAPRTPATVLVSVPPGYALQREQGDDGRVDAWRFEDLVSRAATAPPQRALDLLDEALGLWRGPAFPEFRDESWAGPVADRLEELRCTALESRAQAALALGKHAQVAVDLDPHVAEHPMRENAVRLHALALYRTGRQADALTVLSRTRRLLADELGLDPGPALQSLETAILNQDPSLDAPTGAAETVATSPLPRQAPPRRHLLGRDEEFTTILEGARRAREHGLQLVWLGGEPGAGKSALADAVSTRLAADGWTVCLGRCPEVEGAPPAWAWSEALRALTARHPADPALAERLAPLLSEDTREPSSQFWVARAVAEYLSGFAPVPLLMVLDDVHRADGETLRLLRRVATDLAQAPVLVLASHRPAETTADLGSTWAALTGPASEHLDLTGLDEADVARLLGRYLDDVDDELARQVTERTGGNPLFVCETARLVASEGRGVAMHGIPAGVRDVLRRRIARLPGPSQDVLRTAAIIGRDVEVDVLLATLDEHEDQVLDALEFGVLTGLLTEPAPGQVRFTHALVRDTLYEDTPRLRRTRLHGQVLDAVARTRPTDVTALAHHALAGATASTARRAAGFAADAARHASSMAGFREAAQLWEGALSALELAVGSSDDDARLDAYCGLASAQAHAGNVLAGRAARAAAVSLATKLGDRAALIRALCCYDSEITWSIRPDLQLDHGLVAVLDTVLRDEHDPSDRCKLLCSLTFEVESYDNDRADVTSAAALELARVIPDAALRCRALNARYFVALHPTRRDELEALGRELLDVATDAGLVGYQVLAHHVLYMLALGACKLEDARWHADFAVQRATTGQLGDTLDKLELFDALEDLVTGNFERAEERYLRHTQKMHQSGAANAEAVGALGRAVVRLTAGRGGELVDELRPFYERMPVQALELFVRVLIAAGRVEEARAMWAPDLVVTMDYFYLLWRAIRAENAIHLQDGPVARRCYDELAPHAGQFAGMGGGSVTVGPVDLYLGDLAAFLGDCAGARSHYTAASALAVTVGSPHWAARADASLAAL